MGYCYDMAGRLACDACGKTGGVRKRTCPHRVHYADGGSLPYCQPAALCSDCYRKHKAKLHEGCAAGAAKQNAAEVARKAKLAAGELEVRSAWGDWHETVPTGMTGVLFRNGDQQDYRLMPQADYQPGDKHWLSDYPTAEPWENHA